MNFALSTDNELYPVVLPGNGALDTVKDIDPIDYAAFALATIEFDKWQERMSLYVAPERCNICQEPTYKVKAHIRVPHLVDRDAAWAQAYFACDNCFDETWRTT